MKTAVSLSLPDEVFENAERRASRLEVSRCELYGLRLQDFVRRHAPDTVTEVYDQVCSELDSHGDAFARGVSRATFKSGER